MQKISNRSSFFKCHLHLSLYIYTGLLPHFSQTVLTAPTPIPLLSFSSFVLKHHLQRQQIPSFFLYPLSSSILESTFEPATKNASQISPITPPYPQSPTTPPYIHTFLTSQQQCRAPLPPHHHQPTTSPPPPKKTSFGISVLAPITSFFPTPSPPAPPPQTTRIPRANHPLLMTIIHPLGTYPSSLGT